ncbi:LPS export ABC transporter permease LptG, partial [bacterium]
NPGRAGREGEGRVLSRGGFAMRIMSRYLGVSFLKNSLLTLAALVGLIALFSVFESLYLFFRYNPSFSLYLKMIAARIPWMAVQAMPVSLLIGAMSTLSVMSKNGEITALRASGIPVRKIAAPFFFVALLACALAFFLQETVVPDAYSHHRELRDVKIMAKPVEKLLRSTNVWLKKGNALVNAKWVAPDKMSMKDVKVFELEESRIIRSIAAPEAKWEGGGWVLYGIEQNILTPSGWESSEKERLAYPVGPTPEDIYISRDEPAEMQMGELRLTIDSLKAQGLSTTGLEVDWWAKTSTPFFGLVLTLVAIPFAVRITKRTGLWGAIAKGIGIGLSFYLVHMLGISLGRTGAIPP